MENEKLGAVIPQKRRVSIDEWCDTHAAYHRAIAPFIRQIDPRCLPEPPQVEKDAMAIDHFFRECVTKEMFEKAVSQLYLTGTALIESNGIRDRIVSELEWMK